MRRITFEKEQNVIHFTQSIIVLHNRNRKNNMRQMIIAGRLGRDPETRALQNGKTVCKFSVADSKKLGNGKEDTLWVRVSAWGKTGEVCQNFLRKGSFVIVTGEPSLRTSQDNSGKTFTDLELMANTVDFGPTQQGGNGGYQQQQYNGGYQQQPQQQYAQQPYNPPQNGGQAAPPPPDDDQGDSPF